MPAQGCGRGAARRERMSGIEQPRPSKRELDVVVVGGGRDRPRLRVAHGRSAALRVRVLERDRRGAGRLGRRRRDARPGRRGDLGRGGPACSSRCARTRSGPRSPRSSQRPRGGDVGFLGLGAAPRRARPRRGGGAAPPLRADARARARGQVAAPDRGSRARAGLATAVSAAVHAPARGRGRSRGAWSPPCGVAAERAGADIRCRQRGRRDGPRTRRRARRPHRPTGTSTAPSRGPRGGCLVGGRPGCRRRAAPPVRPVKGQILTLRSSAGPRRSASGSSSPSASTWSRATTAAWSSARRSRSVGFDAPDHRRRRPRAPARGLPRAARDRRDWSWSRPPPACGRARPTTRRSIGRAGVDGLLLATGHYRNGVLLAPVTADAVAAELGIGARPDELDCRRSGPLQSWRWSR